MRNLFIWGCLCFGLLASGENAAWAVEFPTTIWVKGSICDESGKLIKNSRVYYSVQKDPLALPVTDIIYCPEGYFDKIFDNCLDVSLSISAAGYSSLSKGYLTYAPAKGVVQAGPVLLYHNEEYRLADLSKRIKLSRYRFDLRWHPSQGADVFPVNELTTESLHYLSKLEPYAADYLEYTTPVLYLTLTDNLSSPAIQALYDSWDQQRTPDDAYLELVLDDGLTTCGFSVVERTKINMLDQLESMTSAPENGYSRILRVNEGLLVQNSINSVSVSYFYILANGKYGRGCIYDGSYRSDTGGSIRILVELNHAEGSSFVQE